MRLQEAKRDYYRKAARKKGFRSRAAYKLLEIKNSYHVIKRGMYVVDLGSAPGSWLQVASSIVGPKGRVLGVDLRPIEPLPNVEFIRSDVEDDLLPDRILHTMGRRADLLLSDIAPNISGIWQLDHARQISLTQRAVSIAERILAKNGSAVLKAFEGEMLSQLRDELKRRFETVRLSKPKSSRKASSEIYFVCLGFRGS